MDGEDWGVRASTKGSIPLLHPLRTRQNSLRIQGTLLPIPHPREEGHDCRRTGSHRWKATTRRFGHPTRTIYHRHDMRALMEQPDTEYRRAHNGSDATAQVPGSLVRAAACEAA